MNISTKLFALGIGLTFGGLITSIPAEAKNIVTSNYELGSFAQNDPVNYSLLRSKRSLSETLPRVDFIDISSHNGEISVEQFQKMKNMGIKGVVVKLTEGTTYKNPLAPSQINNAKKAGLTVSTYHFSWFENQQEAIDQANYYADYAEELGLSQNSVMVNDAETAPMINADATKVSVFFRDQLVKRGFKNVVHYSSASWFNNNWMEYDVLGKENSWVAEWPANPSANNLLHTDTAAWQWSSKGSFDFVPGINFDYNVDYLGRFTNK
ncbi:GH25 family lysozyme [Enterococcus faecalis]|uniref:GH25 family lysozyme n=1 Tax=Enterococcus faecalis TaxID=1351 RepID=UPI0016395F05|nr:GH25 family lysozyme [Enterococcus faecalis]MBC2826283.1 cell wall hydrolase [Enterococcus faecalis]